jgi:hypothetical protein
MSRYRRNRRRRRRKQGSGSGLKGGGIFVNRRRPESHWIPFYDIYLNIKERVYSWFYGVPEGSYIRWNNRGQITGHVTRAQRPWFSKKR